MEGRRFDPSLILGIGSRCRFGGVRTLVCAPFARGGWPFPTTFWLVCPWLMRRAGIVEAEGGVRCLEERLSGSGEWRAYNQWHQIVRIALVGHRMQDFLRRFRPGLWRSLRLGGVGGTRSVERVKCLHLQAASWLTLRRHPGAAWLRAKGLDGDCGGEMSALCC